LGLKTAWVDVTEAMLIPEKIEQLVNPYLGGDDPIFGRLFKGELIDFFNKDKLKSLAPPADFENDITILYGCGAALADWNATLVYVDLPKNELQFRSRAQSVKNLGAAETDSPKRMYKRFYFVDWIVLNKHKESVLHRLNW